MVPLVGTPGPPRAPPLPLSAWADAQSASLFRCVCVFQVFRSRGGKTKASAPLFLWCSLSGVKMTTPRHIRGYRVFPFHGWGKNTFEFHGVSLQVQKLSPRSFLFHDVSLQG